ncbi:MlaD family protein [Leptolyngbya sp. FACHB-261]|uniref:MlaD family protein n=1 Tax=Leptolyngbya sp. FACHB-261 TaxID=2692806 RepID=UPI001689F5AC|nr:MlaD family protein [Leptolyngbya sp. FACHB-261]MBD2099816.1 MCE family protein [Leptolyngbya sp. FACHB-261]
MNAQVLRREGTLGLLILLGIGLFGGIILWLRGFQPGANSFQFTVQFETASGLRRGAPVRFRGVNIGQVKQVEPGPNGVSVLVEVNRDDLLIPRRSQISSNQSGLVSETTVDITPLARVPDNNVNGPASPTCDSDVIICNNAVLSGETGVSFDQILSMYGELAERLSNARILENINVTTQNIGEAASSVSQLSKSLNQLSKSTEKRLDNVDVLAGSVSRAADRLGNTAENVNGILATNRSSIARTLDSLAATSADVRVVVASLRPLAENGEFVRNLEALSTNAAAAAVSVRSLSDQAGNPTTVASLRETLDSARATFQNAQKITADLDELTGDPQFRTNLRQLVNGLSTLVSTTNDLQEQVDPLAQPAQLAMPPLPSLEPASALPAQTPLETAVKAASPERKPDHQSAGE